MNYPGLGLGLLGRGLDEGETDWKAIEDVGQNVEYVMKTIDLSERSNYANEIALFQRLDRENPGIHRLFAARYQDASLDTSKQLTSQLIRNYGLDKYLDLYLVSPQAAKLGDHNKVGYIEARDWNQQQQ